MPQAPYDKARTDRFNREVEERFKLEVGQSANRESAKPLVKPVDGTARLLTAAARRAAEREGC